MRNVMKWVHGFAALSALALPPLSNGCSTASSIQNTLCCKEYQAGSDMSALAATVDVSIKGDFYAYAQAVGDMSVTASAALADVTGACKQMAVDLGADANDAGATGKVGADLATFWCNAAAAKIDATFSATSTSKADLTMNITPAQCSLSLQAQANCQAQCSVDGKCDLKATPPQCTGGTLEIACKGDCAVTAQQPTIDCTGQCTGQCSGSCQAQANVAVNCDGTCEGTCAGGGSMNGPGIQGDGSCKGTCSGTCHMRANSSLSCSGTCSGTCTATCKAQGGIDAKCSGQCSADYQPIACKGGKLTGGCQVDANCQGNCNASVNAKAECTPPQIKITVSASAQARANAQFDLLVSTIETNLPKLVLVAQTRGHAFLDEINGVVTTGADVAASGKLDTHGTACAVLIGADATVAAQNFQGALNASGTVTAKFQ
jgi:hypothetical protein